MGVLLRGHRPDRPPTKLDMTGALGVDALVGKPCAQFVAAGVEAGSRPRY